MMMRKAYSRPLKSCERKVCRSSWWQSAKCTVNLKCMRSLRSLITSIWDFWRKLPIWNPSRTPWCGRCARVGSLSNICCYTDKLLKQHSIRRVQFDFQSFNVFKLRSMWKPKTSWSYPEGKKYRALFRLIRMETLSRSVQYRLMWLWDHFMTIYSVATSIATTTDWGIVPCLLVPQRRLLL